jgi:hypothetical protein
LHIPRHHHVTPRCLSPPTKGAFWCLHKTTTLAHTAKSPAVHWGWCSYPVPTLSLLLSFLPHRSRSPLMLPVSPCGALIRPSSHALLHLPAKRHPFLRSWVKMGNERRNSAKGGQKWPAACVAARKSPRIPLADVRFFLCPLHTLHVHTAQMRHAQSATKPRVRREHPRISRRSKCRFPCGKI